MGADRRALAAAGAARYGLNSVLLMAFAGNVEALKHVETVRQILKLGKDMEG